MQLNDDYFGVYRTLKLTRDSNGVLVVEFHSNGGPCTFSARHHTEVVDAFHRIAQDRANKIVVLTGAAGDFIIGVDWGSFGDVADPGVWSQIHDEGTQVLENIANIRVPVIAAIDVGWERRKTLATAIVFFLDFPFYRTSRDLGKDSMYTPNANRFEAQWRK